MSKPALFTMWEEPTPLKLSLPWRVQLVNYIGQFATKEDAERFIEATKKAREQDAKSVVKSR